MFKSVGFVALWLVASCAAMAVAWAGVATVGNEIAAPVPASTSSTELAPQVDQPETSAPDVEDPARAAELAEGGTSTVSPSTTMGDLSSVHPESPTTTRQAPGNSSAPSAAPPPTPTAAPSNTTPSPPPTVSPSNPTPSSPPTSTVPTTTTAPTTTVPTTTTTTQPAGETRTFVLVGGTTSVRFEPAGVSVLWATPNIGFEVSVEPESPGWKVEFRADSHRSRVDVWWSGGPQSEIREEPDD